MRNKWFNKVLYWDEKWDWRWLYNIVGNSNYLTLNGVQPFTWDKIGHGSKSKGTDFEPYTTKQRARLRFCSWITLFALHMYNINTIHLAESTKLVLNLSCLFQFHPRSHGSTQPTTTTKSGSNSVLSKLEKQFGSAVLPWAAGPCPGSRGGGITPCWTTRSRGTESLRWRMNWYCTSWSGRTCTRFWPVRRQTTTSRCQCRLLSSWIWIVSPHLKYFFILTSVNVFLSIVNLSQM